MSTNYTRLLQFSQQFGKFYACQFTPLLERTGLTMREVAVSQDESWTPPAAAGFTMNEKQINELLEQIYGEDKVPAEFDGIVKAFSKRKSSIMPSAPTMSEVVMLTVLFDLLKDMTEARKDDESDEDIANDLRGAEQERDPDDE